MAPPPKHGPPSSFVAGRGAATPAANGGSPAIEAIDPLTDPAWDEAVLRHPDATIFHSSAWARVLAQTYGHRPAYFRDTRHGQTEALVPIMEVRSWLTGRRGVCLPFSDFCGPLHFPGADREGLDRHLAALTAERGWKYLEMRDGPATDPTALPTAPPAAPPTEPAYFAHRLALRGTREELEAGFSSSVRRALRKAESNGVTTRVSTSWDAMCVFHRLHLATRRRHGVPPQPLAFFRNIQREILAPGLGFIVIAELRDRPLAAAVFLRFGANGLYKFGASDHGAWDLRPNNPVMAEGICTLAAQGAQSLHFGRTDPHQDGLRRFKRQWGALEIPLFYRIFEPIPDQWFQTSRNSKKNSEWAHAAIRRLPQAVSRSLGCLLYPHLD